MAVVEATPAAPATNGVMYLPVDELVPAPDNPRKDLGDLTELAETIKTVGVLEPLVAVQENGHHVVLLGNRRLAAAKLAGVDVVPVIVRDDLDAAARTEVMLIENLQRADLTPLEEAHAFQRLVEFGLSQRELAGRIGRSQSHVSKRLALLELPDVVHEAVDSGSITIEDAQELATLKGHPKKIAEVVEQLKRSPGGVRWAIDGALRAIKREEKLAKLVADLRKSGETVVRFRDSWCAPNKAYAIVSPYRREGDPDITPDEHESEPCHALGVTDHGQVIELCSDPSRHPKVKAGPTPAGSRLTKEEKAAQEHRDQLQQAHEARLKFLAGLSLGRVSKDDVIAAALPAILIVDSYYGLQIACEILNVELPREDDEEAEPKAVAEAEGSPYEDIDPDELEAALVSLATRSDADRLRVTLAVALAHAEDRASGYYKGWDAATAGYIRTLERLGYKPSKAERAELAKVAQLQGRKP